MLRTVNIDIFSFGDKFIRATVNNRPDFKNTSYKPELYNAIDCFYFQEHF